MSGDKKSFMPNAEFVYSLREAAPYIKVYRGKTFIVVIDDKMITTESFIHLAHDINLLVSLGIKIVLIHGLQTHLTYLLKKYDKNNAYLTDGITDAQALKWVQRAIGMIRDTIETHLSMGIPNASVRSPRLRVISGNFVMARPLGVLNGIDMEHTGCVRKIDTQGINHCLDMGALVLLSPIGFSLTGECFHLPLEPFAAQVAIELKAGKLIFITEQSGLNVHGVTVSSLTAQQAERLLSSNILCNDEITRILPCAIRAVRNGVERSYLVSGLEDGALLTEHFTRNGKGTMLTRDTLVNIRSANIEDIPEIMALILPMEEQGILIKRNKEMLELDIKHYFLLEHDDKIYGCVALYTYPEDHSAELACLVISAQKRDEGFGEMLLNYVELIARKQKMERLFVLTTQTAHWFMEHGFIENDLSALPKSKLAIYDTNRGSKILTKWL